MKKISKKEKPILARNIIQRRSALNYKNAHSFAEAAKIPYPTLRDIEAGISSGRTETLKAIAKALHCSLDDLYQLNPVEKTDTSRDSLIVKAIQMLQTATEADLERVIHLLSVSQVETAKRKSGQGA